MNKLNLARRGSLKLKASAIAGLTLALAGSSMAQETATIQSTVAAIVTDMKAAATTNIGLAMGVGAIFMIAVVAWRAIKRFLA